MRASDVHVHPPVNPAVKRAQEGQSAQQMRQYFRRTEPDLTTPEEYNELFTKHDIVAVLLPTDTRPLNSDEPDPNAWVGEIVRRFPKRFIPFCSVNPNWGKQAIANLERAIGEYDAKGIKFVPTGQNFFANEKQYYPLWEKAQELGVVIITHSGHNGVGSGLPGGGGRKQWFSNPIWWDDVAADFPELKIILAHPAWPWFEEQVSMLVHKANVFMDISGWSPWYFPTDLIREMQTRLQNKVLFGSDFQALSLERWLRDWKDLDVRDEVQPKIFVENAKRVLSNVDWSNYE